MGVKDILKNRRIELGLTMKELSQRVGVSEATISRWESGDIENMRRDKIAALASALKISPSVVMGWESIVHENGQSTAYYVNDETAEIAQDIFDRPDLRILMDAARDCPPESVLALVPLIEKLKETNPDG